MGSSVCNTCDMVKVRLELETALLEGSTDVSCLEDSPQLDLTLTSRRTGFPIYHANKGEWL